MRLTTLIENTNQPPAQPVQGSLPQVSQTATYSTEEVLTATLAVIQAKGKYVSATNAGTTGISTASDVKRVLWGFDLAGHEQRIQQIQSLLNSTHIKQEAAKMVAWFESLPPAQINGNEFLHNVRSVVDRGPITLKTAGFVIGLYPTYERQNGPVQKPGAVKLIREWPQEWGEVKMLYNTKATVLGVRVITGDRGSLYKCDMLLPSGHLFTFFSPGGIKPTEDEVLVMTGYLIPDTYNPDKKLIKFVPERRWKAAYIKKHNGKDEEPDDKDASNDS